MRVVIIGAGQVGSSIAASLDTDHEVVVVDTDAERVDALTYSLDVLAIEGDGASLSTLREAEIEAADLLIASTDDDETNIVACATAKTASDAFTVARVKRTNYLDTWQEAGGAFGVDFMVCTNLLAAETMVRVIGLPAARDVDVFAEGRVMMAEFCVPEGSPVAGRTVAEADHFTELTFAAMLRDGKVVIPDGETTIEAGDELVVIGSPENTRTFAGDLAPGRNEDGKDVVIVGGSEIAVEAARLLEDRGLHPRLVERDPDRARELAEQLAGTTVMQSDATDQEFLQREHVDDADVVIAALGSDEKNLLASLLATRIGVPRTVALVETAEYTDLFEAVGVGAAINPREATAEEIIRLAHDGTPENVAIVDRDRAEVLEIEIADDSVLAGRPIRESAADLPARVTIGAITRDGAFVTPRGDTVVEVGDHVVVFAEIDAIDAVASQV
ncbi:Trk system potassium transporter TrkA [Halococcus saccharolyticus]|uniref:Potassium transporter peripheral membrane component n=1 Tax=Halococcus saccharolyticus DSM 5350 TaxID=1227455 RepID=M0MEF0_9EURY|nr:Trk system potassium transporter TrkA [Halococcus saccharolyticus]EMA44142.1 potassium transporter peripheral membrane component [Halococcus saccharolyticus DSM 5350]